MNSNGIENSRLLLLLISLLYCNDNYISSSDAFVYTTPNTRKQQNNNIPSSFQPKTQLNLIPLNEIDRSSSCETYFLSKPESYRLCIGQKSQLRPSTENQPKYILGIAEEDDLPEVSRLTIEAFGTAQVTLSGDLNEFEKKLIGPTIGLWNQYTDAFAYTEVLSGLRSRTSNQRDLKLKSKGHRDKYFNLILSSPLSSSKERTSTRKELLEIASKSSILLAISEIGEGEKEGQAVNCIATVELRLQPTDGKIPFSQPWLDGIERNIANLLHLPEGLKRRHKKQELQPYLSNLCVSQDFRGRQIGKALVRVVETFAKEIWGYNRLYLHVELENEPALNLYKKEGFVDVGFRWDPFWAGNTSQDIGYYVKDFRKEEKKKRKNNK